MIYLASPYTADDPDLVEARYQAVAKETARLLTLGLIVYSPIVHCHHLAKEYNLPTTFDFWQDYNMGMLSAAQSLWVFTTMGWQESKGVQSEIAFAQRAGKQVAIGEYNGSYYQYC